MLDLKRTLSLISGGIFDAENTWRNYLPEAEDWQKTAILLTGPLIVIGALGAYIFGFLGSDASIFGRFRPTLISTFFAIVSSAVAAAVVAFVVSALAGAFGGKNNFALGLAATTLAFIPGYIGQAVTWLPMIGGLLAIGLFVYALVLLWKVIPVYLAVPDHKRVGHYILSLVVSIAAMVVFSMTFGRFLAPSVTTPSFSDFSEESRSGAPGTGGFLDGIARQADLMAAAEEDRYDPPSNGKVSEDQVEEFIRVMDRASELQEQRVEQMQEIADRAENDENVSFSDLGAMLGSAAEVGGLSTSEIEVVKTAGGNWAEHQWVRESLRTAWIQKDINDAVEHNYELFQEYEEELSRFISP